MTTEIDLEASEDLLNSPTALGEDEVRKAKQLPDPSGWRLLVAIPDLQKMTKGGIVIPDVLLEKETTASMVGLVLKVGPDAYKDHKRFPSGAWCQKGDFVLFRAYSGTRLIIHGKEFRIINDDTVEGVVEDPRGIKRA